MNADNERLSFRGRVWDAPSVDEAALENTLKACANPWVAPVLAAREVGPNEAKDFLNPSLRAQFPNPFDFQDMRVATDRLIAAMKQGQRIGIWTDYDVDGATSGAMMARYLRDCGSPAQEVRVPDRISEGYGPNSEGIRAMRERGIELLLLLDAGTVAHEPLQTARDIGLDVIVIDHHAAEENLPPASALINPNRQDEAPGYGHVCAAGMCLIFIGAATIALRADGYFARQEIPEPHITSYVDLAALGTVCDVVPLRGYNRALVAEGLSALSQRTNPGVRALAEDSGTNDVILAHHCGFQLGPRINAGGRIGEADMGTRLLMTDDPSEAEALAKRLGELNVARQRLEAACTQSAREQIERSHKPGVTRDVAIAVTDAHEGVVGITASRIKDEFDCPSIILTMLEDGTLKGSARSVPGVDIGAAILSARREGILLKGGGHGMAGGMTLSADRLEDLRSHMNTFIQTTDYARIGVRSKVDIMAPLNLLSREMVHELSLMAPFGMGNPEPRVMLCGVRISAPKVLKEKHLKFRIGRPNEGGIDALNWNVAQTEFGRKIIEHEGRTVDVLGKVEINTFKGQVSVQMKVEDVRPSLQPDCDAELSEAGALFTHGRRARSGSGETPAPTM